MLTSGGGYWIRYGRRKRVVHILLECFLVYFMLSNTFFHRAPLLKSSHNWLKCLKLTEFPTQCWIKESIIMTQFLVIFLAWSVFYDVTINGEKREDVYSHNWYDLITVGNREREFRESLLHWVLSNVNSILEYYCSMGGGGEGCCEGDGEGGWVTEINRFLMWWSEEHHQHPAGSSLNSDCFWAHLSTRSTFDFFPVDLGMSAMLTKFITALG